jgi:hypothetical protein
MNNKKETTMVIRLGRVLHWAGWALAAVSFSLAAFTWLSFYKMDNTLYSKGTPIVAVGGPILWGIAAILIGRAARYILADE